MSHASDKRLAFQATTHCLLGCGIGEIVGVIIGTAIGLSYYTNITLGVILGIIFGFSLGIYPLIKVGMNFNHAFKTILTTEFLSILVMETAEVSTELIFPGMKTMGLSHLNYWLGLSSALFMGFLAAYPVNLFLVKKGVQHHH